LLLQIAHPLVAAGVARYSGFASDPFGRLFRTLGPMYTLVFGAPPAVAAAGARLRAAHTRIRGVLETAVGAYPAGTAYDAADPELRLWVHATLVDTSLLVFERFVGPLSGADRRRYYDDSRELARLVDVPERLLPPTLDAFQAYVAGTIASERLAVGETTRTLARLIFQPPASISLRAVGPLVELVSVGLLPPRVRDLYGFRWTPARERALRVISAAVRSVRPWLPAPLTVAPHARAAERRLRNSLPARGGGPR
jgi:uncharacterized protein (DUF2236 family)